MIVARAIKPAAFKSSVFREELLKAANEIKGDALADFKKTTANWKNKPKFSAKVLTGASAGGIQIQVATDDAVYGYVDEGTKPHIIRAKTRKGLRFKVGGSPKTEPDIVGTFPGKPGTDWKRKQTVRHPGTKARNFTKHIAKTTQKELARVTKNALARAARRSGNGINN